MAVPPSDPAKSNGNDSTFEQLLEAAPDAIVGVDDEGKIVLVNSQTEALFGYRARRPARRGRRGACARALPRRSPRAPRRLLRRAADAGRWAPGSSSSAVRKDGTEFPAEISLSSIETEDGTLATAAVRDISDRSRERAGEGASGAARPGAAAGERRPARRWHRPRLQQHPRRDHELRGVRRRRAASRTPQAREDVDEIRRAAERAAALTRQLLIFSRREVVKPELLYLRDVVTELENLLRRALGERVELETQLRRGPLRGRGRPRSDRAGARQPCGQRTRRDARRRASGDRGRQGHARRRVRRHAPRHRARGLRPPEGERHRHRDGQGDHRSGPSSRSSPPRARAKAPASALPPSTASSPARAGGSTSTPSPAWARRSRSTCPPARRRPATAEAEARSGRPAGER